MPIEPVCMYHITEKEKLPIGKDIIGQLVVPTSHEFNEIYWRQSIILMFWPSNQGDKHKFNWSKAEVFKAHRSNHYMMWGVQQNNH